MTEYSYSFTGISRETVAPYNTTTYSTELTLSISKETSERAKTYWSSLSLIRPYGYHTEETSTVSTLWSFTWPHQIVITEASISSTHVMMTHSTTGTADRYTAYVGLGNLDWYYVSMSSDREAKTAVCLGSIVKNNHTFDTNTQTLSFLVGGPLAIGSYGSHRDRITWDTSTMYTNGLGLTETGTVFIDYSNTITRLDQVSSEATHTVYATDYSTFLSSSTTYSKSDTDSPYFTQGRYTSYVTSKLYTLGTFCAEYYSTATTTTSIEIYSTSWHEHSYLTYSTYTTCHRRKDGDIYVY